MATRLISTANRSTDKQRLSTLPQLERAARITARLSKMVIEEPPFAYPLAGPVGGLAACGPAMEGVTTVTVPAFDRVLVFRSHSGSEIGSRCLDTGIESCVN